MELNRSRGPNGSPDPRGPGVEDRQRVPPPGGEEPDPSLAELGRLALQRLEALGDSLRTLWNVRKDRAQLAIRKRMQTTGLLAAVGIAAVAAIIHSMVLIVRGTAAGLAQLFGGRAWLGDLAAGAIVLALVGGGAALAVQRINHRQFVKQREKYAELHRKHDHGPTPH